MDHYEEPFPSPFDKKNPQKVKFAAELRIMTASQRIRARHGWKEDIKNGETIDKWMVEAIGKGLKSDEFTRVLDQLKYFDSLSTESIDVGLVEGTRQAHNLISIQLKNEFVAAVNSFQAKSGKKDYEQGTDDLVVNLLDPRLYSSITNVTCITDLNLNLQNCLQNIGKGESEYKYRLFRSGYRMPIKNLQLLPAEFHVNETGQVKINSYINNLHPKNETDLYSLIERVFTCFVPLFNGVLHDLLHDRAIKAMTGQDHKRQKLDESHYKTYLHGRDIQVIVQMKSIELTPEKPEFNGDDWHIEGKKGEHIVASGIYCFHTENITESRVDLRQLRGRQQELGSLATPENSLIAFPNVCEHRNGPLKLVDVTKPGFRKILIFFLIDPTTRITSTRNVPPQQLTWFEEELLKIPPFDRLDSYSVRDITKYLECPFSPEKAILCRTELINWKVKSYKKLDALLKLLL